MRGLAILRSRGMSQTSHQSNLLARNSHLLPPGNFDAELAATFDFACLI